MSELPSVGVAPHPMLALLERIRPTLLNRMMDIEAAMAALMEGHLGHEQHELAQRAAHQLAGSAGTVGLPRASVLARDLEGYFITGAPSDPGALVPAVQLVEDLRRELESAEPTTASTRQLVTGTRVLMLAFPDRQMAEQLAAAAETRSVTSTWAPDLPTARAMLQQGSTVAVLVDLDLPGGGLALLELIDSQHPETTALVLSRDEAFIDRVEAARAGAHSFLDASQSPDQLLDAVIGTLGRHQPETVRLLSVDDDPVIVAALEAIFSGTGMELTSVTDPLTVWEKLRETAPDILLLDIDMPSVTGLELCRLIRKDPRWATLPILVLTGSIGPERVHEVFAAGADDYVTKPVIGPELVSRIENRLERARLQRRMAEVDQLTGLANRTTLAVEFERLRALADRDTQPLSLAMIDLDGFKRLNNDHGHALGDVILQRLAGQLMTAFKGADVVARWAGQEIAVAMYGMRRVDGVSRVAGALEAFREQSFSSVPRPEPSGRPSARGSQSWAPMARLCTSSADLPTALFNRSRRSAGTVY